MNRTPRWRRAWNAWIAAPEVLRLAVMLVAVLVICALAGCSTTPIATRVPVPIVCQEKVPDEPSRPTKNLPPPGTGLWLDAFVQAATAEIERLEAYSTELRAALIACTRPLPD